MKEFRLSAWPELPPSYHRSPYRRMLNDMSSRYVSVEQLAAVSGASKLQARSFVEMLSEQGLISVREAQRSSAFASLRLVAWLRQAVGR